MKYILPFTLLFLIVQLTSAFAKNPGLSVDFEDAFELNEESILTIYKDSYGYIWIGTYVGLYRSDGTDLHLMQNNPDDSSSINSSVCFSIFEDSKNRIWVGTQKGLDQFDYETGTFIHHIPSNINSYIHTEIRDIAEDNYGNLWLATYNAQGLIKYNPDMRKKDVFWMPNYEEQRLNTVEIKDNIVYIGAELKGLFSLNIDDHSISSILNNFNGGNLTINDIKIIDSTLWFGTWENGLANYNTKSNEIIWHNKNKPYSDKFTRSNIRQLHVDDENNLWLAVYEGGINYFNTKENNVVNINNKNETNPFAKGLTSWFIYIDNENILWLGTVESGLKRIFLNSSKQKYLTFDNKGTEEKIIYINQIIEDNLGNLWIGTDQQGLIKYNIKTNSGERILLQNNNLYVNNVTQDSLDRIWASTFDGVYLINSKTNKIISFIHKDQLFLKKMQQAPSLLYCDKDGDIWISSWQSGLLKIPAEQIKTRTIEDYNPVIYKTSENGNSLINNNVINIYQSSDKTIWISGSYFIQKFSKKDQSFQLFGWFDGSEITEDKSNNIWIASNSTGVIQYKKAGNKLILYRDLYNEKAHAIGIFTDNKNVWLNKKNELLRISNNNDIDFYKADAGVLKINYNTSSFAISEDKILLSGDDGCYIFYPQKVNSTAKPTLIPTHLYIYNSIVKVNDTIGNQIVLTKPLAREKNIKIPAGIKSFSIEFSSNNFINPEEAIYAYKLEGFDTTWTYLNYPNRTATFTNLDGGDYELHMSLVRPFSDWKKNYKTLSIKVLIPFYKTTWFKASLALFLVILIIAFFIFRQKRLDRINTKLENIISIRTAELKMSNYELLVNAEKLNKVNTDLIEKQKFINEQKEEILSQKDKLQISNEKLIESNITKDKLFSIISHDLRSPFSSILGFLKLLHDNSANIKEDTKAEMIKNAYDSSNLVYDLVENLLYWSRTNLEGIDYKLTELNLKTLINKTIGVAQLNSKKKNIGIDLNYNISKELIVADENMLKFILRNLLSNAIKFTPQNGNITVDASQKNNDTIIFIQDNGVGMSDDQMNDLFQISKQISTKGTNQEKGTGLGLILCKEFIEKHNGKIWVESEINKGSTFYFSIPKQSPFST